MNADGTQPINLSNSSLRGDVAPAWSPDGKKIVFSSARDGDVDEVYMMNPDGTAQTRLTVNKAFDDFPAFSPDGKKIAFESNRDGNFEVYAMNPDGTGQTNLTNLSSADDFDADWSVSAADATAPRVDKVEPAENATGVSPTANVSASFSETMNPSTVNTTTFKLRKAGTSTSVGATVTYDAAARKATLDPNAGLTRGATYVATVNTGAKDLAGNALDQNATTSGSQPKTWKFTVTK
jgi:dipeptidyl aminopeptidase/acylaminoacyl peptidase